MPDLSNIIWRSLTGSQVRFSAGNDRIKRFARGFPAMIGYSDIANPDFESLVPLCTPGESFYCSEWRGPEPEGWTIEVDSSMFAMSWNAPPPPMDASFEAIRLGAPHVAQMVAMAALTKPGPFADRPLDIGEWHGVMDGERLVAMAGERLQNADLREVSGVCTLPEYRGRGYAKRLMETVVRSQLARGLKPFLHVASTNTAARHLYERMGFVAVRETPMRVVSLRP